ncbi:amidohydrolase family protein [Ruminococcaceae bacterium OttesenSCG-928-D13]|nr:amidohydrolase family protein [Ruminococcaceae bacterium OttesenSCG-928-D13]
MKYALLCGKLFTPFDDAVRTGMMVLVDGDTITAVQPGTDVPAGYECIDLSDSFVMPGLIDGHVHLTSRGDEPQGEGAYVLPGELTLRAMKNARSDLMAGFTTVRDCGAEEYINHSIRDAEVRGDIEAPRVVSCGRCITTTGGHADRHYSPYMESHVQAAMPADGPMAVRQAARLNLKHGADFLKAMVTGGVIYKGPIVDTQYMADDELAALVEVAKLYGVHTAVHAHGTAGLKAAARAGVTSVEHATMMDDEAVDLFCEKGVYHTPTLLANHRILTEGPENGLVAWMIEKAKAMCEWQEWSVREGLKRGVRFAFGTDAGTPYNFHGRQAEEFVQLARYGFTPRQMLTAATHNNAALLGMETRLGEVKAGYLADICAFDKDAMENANALLNCRFVMKGGVVYKKQAPSVGTNA